MTDKAMNEPGKIEVEEVSAVPSAPRARVEVDTRDGGYLGRVTD